MFRGKIGYAGIMFIKKEKDLNPSGFDKEDSFFKMQTFRASRDLSEEHDEIYDEKI